MRLNPIRVCAAFLLLQYTAVPLLKNPFLKCVCAPAAAARMLKKQSNGEVGSSDELS